MASAASNRVSTRLAIRLIPIFILCAFVVATYIYVGHICVQYYIRQRRRTGFAAGMIVLYFVIFFLMLAAYLRTFVAVIRDPGLVPLINGQTAEDLNEKQPPPPRRRRRRRRGGEPEEPDAEAQQATWAPVDTSPDSPGLEAFYSKDVFVCEADGRPKWCSGCRQWKPDRAHHSSELGRCVRKMDHLCPWVGGMVSETSFNFFAQFTFYCALYCSITLALTGYTVSQQSRERPTPDGWVVAGLVLSAFFLLFSGGMALTSLRYILTNMTNIDMFSRSRISYLAVRVPLDAPPSQSYPTVTYPLQQPPVPPQPLGVVGTPPPPPPANPGESILNNGTSVLAAADRDVRARRKFAILRVEARENPWDLGPRRNWTSVMGRSPWEWLLPIRHSPCCDHDSMTSDYPTRNVLDGIKKRHNFAQLELMEPSQPKGHDAV
ncbi:DHHC zinc finger membrane protein [Cordyceps fumosorosea ARSEF 2679]|uniref:Palmitoyltransferase n=1 Tax=Cordyceps fumosorosea (strain ARSEF 2679) TaxID=1081104 RepID=A0A167T022_CORFA|nr:DHHC zinc finger membrane protein [Cordyceps fumosorosea ARSEF 2679]OAA60108.1 DHHC zinc finger membrane protein [Cordyceps fumosorosea ARSEF 2679]